MSSQPHHLILIRIRLIRSASHKPCGQSLLGGPFLTAPERHNITFYFYRFAMTSDMHASLIMRSLMIRQGACMHASTFEVCFIYHQGLSVIAQEALTDGGLLLRN